jgi:hypothetical protein
MGANVGFIAFREAPNVAKLAAIPGLTGFRLFKHKAKPEWYLEGPSPDGDAITFYEPLDYAPKGDLFKQAQDSAKSVVNAFKHKNLRVEGFDERAVVQALTLNLALGVATLLIYSNDDGIDAGFICVDGKIMHAKLPTRLGEMTVFENGEARVEPPNSEEYVEGEPVFDLHQFASEVANTFFRTSIRWRVTSDPADFESSEFTLLAASGQRTPFKLPGDDVKVALWAIESGAGTDAEKLRKCCEFMDSYVVAATEPHLISAARVEVDYADFQILACSLHASGRRYGKPAYATLSAYFSDLQQYLRRLKPKPDFRHDINFQAEGGRLRAEWRALRARLRA